MSLDQQTANALLRYDQNTGKLFWKQRGAEFFSSEALCKSWNTRFAGREITSRNKGYACVTILGKWHQAHRIIWLMVHGEWPDQLDHINGKPDDNRLANLRNASCAQNCANRKVMREGLKGATFVAARQKWRATIHQGGRKAHLGYHSTEAEAHRAYMRAAREAHGVFARAG